MSKRKHPIHPSRQFTIYTDGASRSNPGHAGAAFLIYQASGELLYKEGVYIGKATNNEAEYWAVKLALQRLREEFRIKMPAEVEVRADSLLIINQLKGLYKINSPELKVLYDHIKILETEVGKVVYNYIPREQNSLADKEVNQALDEHFQNN